MIGVLPGEGEALAQFDSVFLTQFHWELLSRSNFSHKTRLESTLEAKLSYTVKIVDETIERIALQKSGRVFYASIRSMVKEEGLVRIKY